MPGNTIETREVDDMSVKLSKQKVSKVMRLYFQGLPQPVVAKEASVDQSTVSIYATRLRNRVGEVGLAAASKEVGVFDQVDALRSLSVELSQAGMTADDAKKGLGILKSFMKLGVQPEEHTALIKTCHEIDDAGFVHAAVKLSKIEVRKGMTYDEVMSRFENVASQLPRVEKKLKGMQAKLRDLEQSLTQRRNQVSSLEAHIEQLQREARQRRDALEREYAARAEQLGVKSGELEEVAQLKRELAELGLDIRMLARVASEFASEDVPLDGTRIRTVFEKHESILKQVHHLETLKSAYEAQVNMLDSLAAKLRQQKEELLAESQDLDDRRKQTISQLTSLDNQLQQRRRQYQLFESFIAMAECSPSVTKSIEDLIAMFQWLLESGWDKSLEPSQLRSIFVDSVLGRFLNCYRCAVCDTRFILSKGARSRFYLTQWCCSICHSTKLMGDDSLLQAIDNS